MQQFGWMSLVDAMFLEFNRPRDVVDILIGGLGLDANNAKPSELSQLGCASFERSQAVDLTIEIPLSSSRVIYMRAHHALLLPELLSFTHLVQLALKTAEQRESLVLESITDPLTSLLNRRGWENYLSTVKPIVGTLAFLDVDGLKQANHELGYVVTDERLRVLGIALRGAFRSIDCVCRWGGDEFVVFLKNLDPVIAEKRLIGVIRQAGTLSQLTLSYGLAYLKDDHHSVREALTIAQREMETKKPAIASCGNLI